MKSSGQLALLTGGSGFVGQAIVARLVSVGWDVAILSRSDKKVEGATTYVCDITSEKEVQKTIEEILQSYESISACVHAASPMLTRKPLSEATPEEFKVQLDVAYLAASLLAKYALPHMSAGSAFIGITTAAIEPGVIPTSMGAYPLAKKALRDFLATLSKEKEVIAQDIRVYAVAPGFLSGGLNSDLPEPVQAFFSNKHEGGAESPEQVAEVISVLLQEPAKYESGTSIRVSTGVASPL